MAQSKVLQLPLPFPVEYSKLLIREFHELQFPKQYIYRQ